MAASFRAVAGEIPPEAQDPVLSHSPGLVPERPGARQFLKGKVEKFQVNS